jgi:hypothetical protein
MGRRRAVAAAQGGAVGTVRSALAAVVMVVELHGKKDH